MYLETIRTQPWTRLLAWFDTDRTPELADAPDDEYYGLLAYRLACAGGPHAVRELIARIPLVDEVRLIAILRAFDERRDMKLRSQRTMILRRFVKDRRVGVSRAAIVSLMFLRATSAWDDVVARRNDRSPTIRAQVLRYRAYLRPRESRLDLHRALDDPSPLIRLAGADGLDDGNMVDLQTFRRLQRMAADDPDAWVRTCLELIVADERYGQWRG